MEPQRRAAVAAKALAAEGKPVTNRTVRERAGVAMAVAAEAAREWSAHAVEQTQVPEAPESVRVRVAAIWREAYFAARDEFAAERDSLTGKLHVSDDEIESLTKDLTESEARIAELEAALKLALATAEQAARDAEQAAAAVAAEQIAALVGERSRADRAEGALEVVTAERDRILTQMETARASTRD